MRKAIALLILMPAVVAAVLFARAQDDRGPDTLTAPRFGHVDVFIDSAAEPLAAYHCEITATAGDVTLVGIEGGEHAAFKEPPYYDPKALGQKPS